MSTQNPTAGDGGASTLDPLSQIEAALDAQAGGSIQDAPEENASDTDEPEEGDRKGSAEPQFTTEHLASFLGIDPEMVDVDEAGEPVFKAKVDGKEQAAKFKDFLSDYQKRGSADNRLREAAERERAAERKMQEAEQAVQSKLEEQQRNLTQIGQVAAILQQELQGEYQSYDWPELYASDMKTAKALEMRFTQRQQRINAVMQQLAQRAQLAKSQAEEAKKSAEAKAMESQRRQLRELIPEWTDDTVAAKEANEIQAWARKANLDLSDFDLNKASQVAMLRRAWQHDTLQRSKPEVENRLRQAPKLVKPGTPATKGEGEQARRKAHLQAIKKASSANSTKAFAEFLLATGQA